MTSSLSPQDDSYSKGLQWLNALDQSEARAAILQTCGSEKFASLLGSFRPFHSVDDVVSTSRDVWWNQVDISAWKEAFAAHPRIGDVDGLKKKFAHEWCAGEQSTALETSNENTIRELALWNRKYEQKFGHIFIVCATGLSSSQVLTAIKSRFPNQPLEELHVAAKEQQKITELRIRKLLSSPPLSHSPTSSSPSPSSSLSPSIERATAGGFAAPRLPSPTAAGGKNGGSNGGSSSGGSSGGGPSKHHHHHHHQHQHQHQQQQQQSSTISLPPALASGGGRVHSPRDSVAADGGGKATAASPTSPALSSLPPPPTRRLGAGLSVNSSGVLRPPITTHVLDTALGRPAQGVRVKLQKLLHAATSLPSDSEERADGGGADGRWVQIGESFTDADGRSGHLMAPSPVVEEGTYKLTFFAKEYFQFAHKCDGFYPVVTIVFAIAAHQTTEHFHVPVLLSPWSYTTYRGS